MEKQRWVLFLHLFFLITNFKSCVSTTNSNRVNHLPGQYFTVDFEHYSGYVTVNEDAGRNLFYWFIEATKDPSSKPLILWIYGGPGCSSIGYGEAMEVGPFHVEEDGKTLYLNPYSWNQMASLLLIGTPVGTGYSYSKDSEDVINNGDARTAQDNLVFLQKWLERFPQYKGSDFYIVGESYAGEKYMGGIHEEFDPCIEDHTSVYFNLPEVQRALHADPAGMTSAWKLASSLSLSQVMFTLCRGFVDHHWKDSPASVLDIYHDLIHLGLRIWMISGDTDSVTPVTSTRYIINSLKFPSVTPFHAWYDNRQVGGWTQEYKGLTFVSVRGAGHDIPMYKPSLAYPVIKAYLSGIAMPTQSSQLADS
ncbi:hypothetical protein MKX01_022909 [Papaver californicum]|nr:hypothetical protein MKX01_022909 [Papaver californicum]